MSVPRAPIIEGTWRKAKRGKSCHDCLARIPEGGYYLEVSKWLWLCPGCARKLDAAAPRPAGPS